MRKRLFSVFLVFVMMSVFTFEVLATTADDVKKEQQQTQEQLNEVNDKMDDLESAKDAVSEEITVLDTELVDILTSISVCEDEIYNKEQEIEAVKEELAAAEEQETVQYESMMTRIQFMYERGDTAYVQALMEATSFSDMLNKASYVEKLYAYDRDLLDQYIALKDQITEYKAELEIEEAELVAAKNELQEQQEYLEGLIEEKQATVANFDAQLVAAQKEADSYKKQIREQNDQIKKLEEEEAAAKKKAEEEAAKKKTQTTTTTETADASDSTTNTSTTTTTTTTTTETTTPVSTGSGKGGEVVSYACQFIGNPYVYGGTSLTNGTDCSGFTQAVYAHFGYRIPRDSTSQRYAGIGVDYANAQPGDIICYAGHVALYMGNGQIVHASTERTGITTGKATYRTILAVRRIIY